MELRQLYDFAQQQNIPICHFSLPKTGSMSLVTETGQCYIGLDPGQLDGGIQERVHLSHELGHCVTGSFYNIYTPRERRLIQENRATKWAIEALIPVDDLDQAIAEGYTEVRELAQRFQVTEDFIRKTVSYYVYDSLTAELYF